MNTATVCMETVFGICTVSMICGWWRAGSPHDPGWASYPHLCGLWLTEHHYKHQRQQPTSADSKQTTSICAESACKERAFSLFRVRRMSIRVEAIRKRSRGRTGPKTSCWDNEGETMYARKPPWITETFDGRMEELGTTTLLLMSLKVKEGTGNETPEPRSLQRNT